MIFLWAKSKTNHYVYWTQINCIFLLCNQQVTNITDFQPAPHMLILMFVGCSLGRIEYKFNPPCACITVVANFTACPSRSLWLDICPTLDSSWLSQAQMAPGYRKQREKVGCGDFTLGDLLTQISCHNLHDYPEQFSRRSYITYIYIYINFT